MSRLPALSPRKVAAALEKAGLLLIRMRGSHYFHQHPQDKRRRKVAPYHAGDVPIGTLRVIIEQAGLTVEEFLRFL
ncbi:MAG: type II toxin-antitoxin system HicA family toxin [Proteobacteria bacterium]|nr:type II toxin-antitoxin system HicA family toxin [Pseudomonadota bacterium]